MLWTTGNRVSLKVVCNIFVDIKGGDAEDRTFDANYLKQTLLCSFLWMDQVLLGKFYN